MVKTLFSLYLLFLSNALFLLEVLFVGILIFLIKKHKLSGEKIGLVGFILLFITMIFSILQMDNVAGAFAEFVWISFFTSFIVEFYQAFFVR